MKPMEGAYYLLVLTKRRFDPERARPAWSGAPLSSLEVDLDQVILCSKSLGYESEFNYQF